MKKTIVDTKTKTLTRAEEETIDGIRDRIKDRTDKYYIDTGRDLIEAKAILGHGKFMSWVKSNFDFSNATAHNFMNAAKLVEKIPTVGNLPQTAVMALAAPNVPEKVTAEVVADIASGKVLSTKDVKAKVAEAKAETKPLPVVMGATESALPVKPANDQGSVDLDLIERLKAAGLHNARAAFKTAYPDSIMVSADRLKDLLAKEREKWEAGSRAA